MFSKNRLYVFVLLLISVSVFGSQYFTDIKVQALELFNELVMSQIATPANPSSGKNKLYFKSDNELYMKNSSGTETQVSNPTVSPSFTTVTKTTSATLATSNEDNVLCDTTSGNVTLTLPAASGNSGLTYKITVTNATNDCIIDGNASETIGGDLTITLSTVSDSVIITTDGSNWYYISEEVMYAARYTTNAGQTVSSNSVIVFEDLGFDTHSAYNTTTGVYTVPKTGLYLSRCTARTNVGTNIVLSIEVNGADVEEFSNADTGDDSSTSVSALYYLTKSDTVECVNNTGASRTLNTSSTQNVFSIHRIK